MVVNHTLNEGQIALIKRALANRAEKGKPSDYEIRINKMTVVQRTNDIEKFDGYKELYSEATTDEFSVLIYEGKSRNNTHHLYIRQEKATQENYWHPYSKLSPEEVIMEKISHEKRLWEYQQVQQENLNLKKEIDKLKSSKEELKDTIATLEDRIRSGDKNWGNVISYGFEAMVKRNIPVIAKIPGMEGIAEYLQNEKKEQQPQYVKPKAKAEEETQAEVKSSPENPGVAEILTKEFGEEKMKTVSEILVMLAKRPDAVKATKAFLQMNTVKEQLKSIWKKMITKLDSYCKSFREWVSQKYLFILECINGLKFLIKNL